ncbi:DUF4333 domain-containing protein [Leptolyngbya sp. FACHB-36]|uniref:DUF4333 domain-containing protein n=1 Tax=Leptolyngbya sp. FACHB-36 TaxID=2692808 RepID=UPI001680E8B9|nr:DUF4333 domain-containing protein [Leptolyngbya sp. FACHB-36]MBD2022679.1 DUF4333 domain-containing protein [Leptolyngbya sp. FACHB-36]
MKLVRYLLPFLVLPLAACEKTLETDRVAQAIQQDIIKQGGVSLKSVSCPKGVKPEAEVTFECTGEMDNGYTFTIPVKQQDAQGSITWDVPHAKGLLNLVKFENLVQEVVQGEIGVRPLIRCGDGYKAVKPGQTFECQMERPPEPKGKKPAAGIRASKTPVPAVVANTAGKPTKPDKIVVSIDTESNIAWERVIPGVAKPASATAPQSGQTTAAAQPTANTPASIPAAATAQPASSAAQPAIDPALNPPAED